MGCLVFFAKSLQSLTLCDPMDCSPSGSSVQEILQERILEWVAMPSSRASSPLRAQMPVFMPLVLFQFSQWCPTLCDPMDCSTPGLPVHHQLPEFTQTHVHSVRHAIQPSHPRQPLPLPPSIFPNIRVFSNESVLCIRWPKYWSIHFSIRPSNEYSGLSSLTTDLLDLPEV